MSTTTNGTATANRFLQPALLGGLVTGALSALPLVSAGNFCCCLWVVVGGLAASYLVQQRQEEPLTPGDAALAGLLAGVAGAVVYVILSVPISLLLAPMERAILERLTQVSRTMPPELREYLKQPPDAGTRIVFVLVQFVVMLVVAPLFSVLGALLGAALFRKPSLTAPAKSPVEPPPSTTSGPDF